MNRDDIRWKQRFINYKKALALLEEAVFLSRTRSLSFLEEQGLIQGFEYTYELAWNTLKDFLQERGNQNVYGSRDAIQEAFKAGLIQDGEAWMVVFKDHNKTTHTYNKPTATEIANSIKNIYYDLFKELELTFGEL
ncbi:MAG TPA: nucleotidyltransferase substrate binding protein [Chlamydiales bacterium]|nr:nucleotidyltransferase substrate binding protein [Chlamydiales bacterium]